MKRLTVYLKNQKKLENDGKKKLFNVKSFHHVTEHEAMRLVATFDQKDLIKYEILQIDTIPHNVSCSIDFVIKKLK